jgi:uncharacterized cupin superfamily protein
MQGSSQKPTGTVGSLEALVRRLEPQPINPSWILSGTPQARSSPHSSGADGGSSTNVWDCSAGSFHWHFGWDETVLILDGGVTVTSPTGEVTALKSGDVAYFPAGTVWTWEVASYVRKLAFHRRPSSRIDRTVQRVRRTLGSRSARLAIVIGIVAVAAVSTAVVLAMG